MNQVAYKMGVRHSYFYTKRLYGRSLTLSKQSATSSFLRGVSCSLSLKNFRPGLPPIVIGYHTRVPKLEVGVVMEVLAGREIKEGLVRTACL